MKTKYVLIYVFVGIAFLAVSAWVYFTHGKSAKAIKAKYRLGSILLMCTASLTATSCFMCYAPIMPESVVEITQRPESDAPETYEIEIRPGECFSLLFNEAFCDKYLLTIIADDAQYTELQREVLVVNDSQKCTFDITLSPEITYKGSADLRVQAINSGDKMYIEFERQLVIL